MSVLKSHHKIIMKIIFFILFLSSFSNAFSNENIKLFYFERAPFVEFKNKLLSGITGEKSLSLFLKANIPFKLENVPAARQLKIIKENSIAACGIGWFKNAQREQFAKFTLPLYQDGPLYILAHPDHGSVEHINTLDSLLSNKSLTLLVKSGFSYGQFLDDLILKKRPNLMSVTVNNVEMVNIIKLKRADYMFTSKEEGEYLLRLKSMHDVEDERKKLILIHLEDSPPGEKRYLMCSKKVSDETITRLNSFIDKL